jgi:PKD repeat protein
MTPRIIARRGVLALLCAALLGLLAGCESSAVRPAADFTWCPDGSSGALDYLFVSTSTEVPGHEIVQAVWEFGDGTPPVEILGVAAHRFLETGSYSVVLTVTDRRGVVGTTTKELIAEPAAFVDPTWRLTLGYPPTVSGVVGNRSGVRLDTVTVRAKFYDPDGVRVSDAECEVLDLEPGERARFEIEASEFLSRVFYATVEIESFEAACALPLGSAERRVDASTRVMPR